MSLGKSFTFSITSSPGIALLINVFNALVKTWLVAKFSLINSSACSEVSSFCKYSGNLIKLFAWSTVKLLGFNSTPLASK